MDVLERINHSRDAMSKSFRKVADFICENYEEIAFMSVADVAQNANVSESVVVRFAASLDYSGFVEMKKHITEDVKTNLQLPRRMIDVQLSDESTPVDILTAVFNRDMDNLLSVLKSPYNKAFGDVIEVLKKAKRVYIIGSRGLKKVADLAVFLFDFVGIDAVSINAEDSSEYQWLCRMDQDSVLMVLSLPRYNSNLTTALQLAQKRQAKSVAICDNVFAPDAKLADRVLMVKAHSDTFINSYSSLISMLTAIVSAIGIRYRDDTISALSDMENCIQYFKKPEDG